MKLTKLVSALAVAGAAFAGSAAHAAPTISNLDGNLTPFGGFDWNSAGFAWTSGFTGVVGSTFTLNFASWASELKATDGTGLTANRLDKTADGVANSAFQTITGLANNSYEYTTVASVTEKIVACGSQSGICFQVTGGSFDIYYDVAANAKVTAATGTGFKDGVKVISGSVNASPGTDSFDSITGATATLYGAVTTTNATYINPALVGSILVSTLQLSNVTGVTVPSVFEGSAVGGLGQVVFQADANQTFTTVPEPGALLLAGTALLGLAGLRRRRK